MMAKKNRKATVEVADSYQVLREQLHGAGDRPVWDAGEIRDLANRAMDMLGGTKKDELGAGSAAT